MYGSGLSARTVNLRCNVLIASLIALDGVSRVLGFGVERLALIGLRRTCLELRVEKCQAPTLKYRAGSNNCNLHKVNNSEFGV